MRNISLLIVGMGFGLAATSAQAEPWMAVQAGVKCVACHVNPTGGGKRSEFGHVFGLNTLTARKVTDFKPVGKVTDTISLGGDLRFNAAGTRVPNQDDTFAFESEEILVYLQVDLIPSELTLYVDERLGPGGASNRELYGLYWLFDKKMYVKAGRMFLPFGLRLEDDTAFIRQVTGINYNTPDDGIELGLELSNFSVQLAVTNGTAGGTETNRGKQYSVLAGYIHPRWRLGLSYNLNDVGNEDRSMAGAFLGLRTGIINWLAEFDTIKDKGAVGGELKQHVSFIEANVLVTKGHNLKLTYEHFDPSRDIEEDERTRASIVWEWFPIQFTQLSLGYRDSSGIPQNDLQNIKEYFLQLHVYF